MLAVWTVLCWLETSSLLLPAWHVLQSRVSRSRERGREILRLYLDLAE